MSIKKFITIALLLASLGTFYTQKVLAQYGDVEPGKRLSIDKQVYFNERNAWVDNIFSADKKFRPGDTVSFVITITNTTDQTLERISVKDILPSYLEFVSGPLEFVLSNLGPGQSYTSDTIYARVLSTPDFDTYCVNNIARAELEDETYEDQAQICIEQIAEITTKGGLPIQKGGVLPEAGPVENLAILLGSTLMAIAGGALIKKKK